MMGSRRGASSTRVNLGGTHGCLAWELKHKAYSLPLGLSSKSTSRFPATKNSNRHICVHVENHLRDKHASTVPCAICDTVLGFRFDEYLQALTLVPQIVGIFLLQSQNFEASCCTSMSLSFHSFASNRLHLFQAASKLSFLIRSHCSLG